MGAAAAAAASASAAAVVVIAVDKANDNCRKHCLGGARLCVRTRLVRTPPHIVRDMCARERWTQEGREKQSGPQDSIVYTSDEPNVLSHFTPECVSLDFGECAH